MMSNKLTAFVGALIGFGAAIMFTVFGMRSWWIFLLFPLIGAVSGFIYRKKKNEKEAFLRNAANLEAAKNQRIQWAELIKQMITGIAEICEKNAKDYYALVTPKYKADAQMDKILKELSNASELKGKVDAMAKDTKTKGGISK